MHLIEYLEIIENLITKSSPFQFHHFQLITVIILINSSVNPPLWVSSEGKDCSWVLGVFHSLMGILEYLENTVTKTSFQHHQTLLIIINTLLNFSKIYVSLMNLAWGKEPLQVSGLWSPVPDHCQLLVGIETLKPEEDQKSSKRRRSTCPNCPLSFS